MKYRGLFVLAISAGVARKKSMRVGVNVTMNIVVVTLDRGHVLFSWNKKKIAFTVTP